MEVAVHLCDRAPDGNSLYKERVVLIQGFGVLTLIADAGGPVDQSVAVGACGNDCPHVGIPESRGLELGSW